MLHIAKGAQEYTLSINQVYRLKEGFGPPYRYFWEKNDKFKLEDGRSVWYMTCIEYLHGAIKNVDLILEGNKAALKSFGDGYCPYP